MHAHGADSRGMVSFAEECRKLLQQHADHASSMISSKSSKREDNRKFQNKIYHIQKKDSVQHNQIKMTWNKKKFPKLNVIHGKSKIRGSETVLSHYHYRMDPKLGKSKCAMRRIPCLCLACSNQLDLDWIPGTSPSQQPRYQMATGCKYASILGHYNKWLIMDLLPGEDTDLDELNIIHQDILNSLAHNLASTITENSYGSVNTDDPQTEGFYIVMFTSEPYSLQEEINVHGDIINCGTLVCDAKYCSPAQINSRWYVHLSDEGNETTIQVSKILTTQLSVEVVSDTSHLDRSVKTITQSELSIKKPFKLSDFDYDCIRDKQQRREDIEYEMENMNCSDDEIETEEI